MANEAEKKILATMPWKNPLPNYSYAGVAVFEDNNSLIVAPLQTKDAFINYCVTRAMKIGEENVEKGIWISFEIVYNNRTRKKWPHVKLKGKPK